jgi:hypothetical protein
MNRLEARRSRIGVSLAERAMAGMEFKSEGVAGRGDGHLRSRMRLSSLGCRRVEPNIAGRHQEMVNDIEGDLLLDIIRP